MTDTPLASLQSLVSEVGTQELAAKKLGISQQYFGKLLWGKVPITEGIAKKLGYQLESKWIKAG